MGQLEFIQEKTVLFKALNFKPRTMAGTETKHITLSETKSNCGLFLNFFLSYKTIALTVQIGSIYPSKNNCQELQVQINGWGGTVNALDHWGTGHAETSNSELLPRPGSQPSSRPLTSREAGRRAIGCSRKLCYSRAGRGGSRAGGGGGELSEEGGGGRERGEREVAALAPGRAAEFGGCLLRSGVFLVVFCFFPQNKWLAQKQSCLHSSDLCLVFVLHLESRGRHAVMCADGGIGKGERANSRDGFLDFCFTSHPASPASPLPLPLPQ